MTTPNRSRDLLILAALCLLCFFWKLGAVDVIDFNDALYAQVAREMFLRGDFVTPVKNGLPWFDKPPLVLWLSALSFHVFGVSSFAARFPVAVAATLTVFLTYWFGARYLGRRAGMLAAFILAVSPIFFGTARQMTMDIVQSLCVAAGMLAFFLGYTGRSPRSGWWYYAAWAACGLGVLAKSAPGLLPLPCAAVFIAVDQRFRWRDVLRRVWETRLLLGIPLMLAVVLPWHVLMYRAQGAAFVQEYLLHHNVGILNAQDFGHEQPFWFYVVYLAAGFFPWAFLLVPALASIRRGCAADSLSGEETDPALRARALTFVLVWAVATFVLFSAMRSKLVSYLLPMYPAAALIVGVWLQHAMAQKRSRGLQACLTLLAALLAGALVFGEAKLRSLAGTVEGAKLAEAVGPGVVSFALVALVTVTVGTLAAALLAWRRRSAEAVLTTVGTYVAFIALAVGMGLPALQQGLLAPLHALAREAGEQLARGTPVAIYIASPVKPSVFFYLPDSAFRERSAAPPRPPGDGYVLEGGEKPPILRYLQGPRPANILTDARRAEDLLRDAPDLVVLDRRSQWVLLRANPEPSAAR